MHFLEKKDPKERSEGSNPRADLKSLRLQCLQTKIGRADILLGCTEQMDDIRRK